MNIAVRNAVYLVVLMHMLMAGMANDGTANNVSSESVRCGLFLDRSHLTLQQIIIIMYCWAQNIPQKVIKHEVQIHNDVTIVDWCNFIRDVCEEDVESHSQEIGGIHDSADPIIVEIDESNFFHHKYHRGVWRPGHWVFGGIERH